jgi:hypothetical protein
MPPVLKAPETEDLSVCFVIHYLVMVRITKSVSSVIGGHGLRHRILRWFRCRFFTHDLVVIGRLVLSQFDDDHMRFQAGRPDKLQGFAGLETGLILSNHILRQS